MWACEKGFYQIVHLLIEKEAEISSKDMVIRLQGTNSSHISLRITSDSFIQNEFNIDYSFFYSPISTTK